jgi:hypothetical protein
MLPSRIRIRNETYSMSWLIRKFWNRYQQYQDIVKFMFKNKISRDILDLGFHIKILFTSDKIEISGDILN